MGRVEGKVSMSSSFAGKTVLITGGTGSFGTTMARHALSNGVAELRIFSRDEAKQDQMRHSLRDERVKFILGDSRDKESVASSMRGVDLVFHAAAIKQVPSAEFFPMEAVKTNIEGSANVLSTAIAAGVSSVVCLSTDKAVYPINTMGMTKALMEKTAFAFARDARNSGTTISVTRYGNVMNSRGSVIPLFASQIRSGRPVTITDPTMTRFLMTLDESVDLVEHAFSSAITGDLFVRKAPACSIEQLARVMIQKFGSENTRMEQLGFRHGEKLFESLLGSEERSRAEETDLYFRVPLDTRDLNYEEFFEEGESRDSRLEAYTSHNTRKLNDSELEKMILTSLDQTGGRG